jgi:hypothetical protein
VSHSTTRCVALYHSLCPTVPLAVSHSTTRCVPLYHSLCPTLPLAVTHSTLVQVLAEFGVVLSQEKAVHVHDSTADMRYMVSGFALCNN